MNEPAFRNAAIYYVKAGYSTDGSSLMGINAASEGMLRGLAVHGGLDRLYALAESEDNGIAFDQAVRGFNPALSTEWISTIETGRLAEIGTVMLPGPGLGAYGWARRSAGRRAYSLCGITHTTASPLALDTIAGLPTVPVYPWDAVICTSEAVRHMVLTILKDQSLYLRERFGPIDITIPQLPVIPLGIECDHFEPDPVARARWRDKMGIAPDDVALLYLGRLSLHAKAHPLPLFRATNAAARTSTKRLHLIMAGWFAGEAVEQAYHTAAREACPLAAIHFVDGRLPAVRKSIRSAADIFISPVDNIQETFGLAPIEAMAAGLPVIASDWNGYKETIRDGVDGYRIPTTTVPPGVCDDLGMRYAAGLDDYERYVGQASQVVSIDPARLADAIVSLADDAGRRSSMGAAAKERARDYDWRHIIARYQELWAELARRRSSAPSDGAELPVYPARPDPFHAFQNYPTRFATWDLPVRRTDASTASAIELRNSPTVSFVQDVLPGEAELVNLLRLLDPGEQTIKTLVESSPQSRRRSIWRGIVWLEKFGLVTIG